MSATWIGTRAPLDREVSAARGTGQPSGRSPVDALLDEVEVMARRVPWTAEIPDALSSRLQAKVHDEPGVARRAEHRLGARLARQPDDEAAFRMWRILRDARTIDAATRTTR